MKKSRRTYNGVHLNKKSNTQDVVEQSLTIYFIFSNKKTADELLQMLSYLCRYYYYFIFVYVSVKSPL